jgi:hypothetical protein
MTTTTSWDSSAAPGRAPGSPSRRGRITALLVALVLVVSLGLIAVSVWPEGTTEPPPGSASRLTDVQRAHVQLTMMRFAAVSDPAVTTAEALAATSGASAWPANVRDVSAVLTDRRSALAAIGTPGAAPQDQRPVILVQAVGDFVSRRSAPGGSPSLVPVHHLVLVYDIGGLGTRDSGMSDTPADLASLGPVETWYTAP